MNIKAQSWRLASIYFIFMMACYLIFSAMSPPLRQQMASIHSLFWTLALPCAAACSAVFSAGVWFVAYFLAKRRQAKTR